MDTANAGQHNERQLFHSTLASNVSVIDSSCLPLATKVSNFVCIYCFMCACIYVLWQSRLEIKNEVTPPKLRVLDNTIERLLNKLCANF